MLNKQVEVGKRERLLASAEIEGLKKYHFKEVHALQDQLLAQRASVSKLTTQLQEALQVICNWDHTVVLPSFALKCNVSEHTSISKCFRTW